MREAYSVWETQPVRWADMDSMGHVNNAKYFTYCESARMLYFDAVGMQWGQRGQTLGPVVVSATVNFRRQVRWPATVEVGVRAIKIGNSSFTLDYGLFLQGTDEPVADGQSTVVWVDYAAGSSHPLPEDLKARIRELDGFE